VAPNRPRAEISPAGRTESGMPARRIVSCEQLKWNEARVRCRELGGHFAVAKTKEEDEFLSSVVKADGT
jgi:hypothetical protein